MRYINKLAFYFFLVLSLSGFGQNNSEIDKQVAENDAKAEAFLSENGKENAAAQLYNQSAYLLRSANRLDEAAGYYQKVLDINIATGNRRGQMISYNSLSMVYLEAENYTKAVYYLKKELEFRKKDNNKADIINVLANLAIAENETSTFDSAIEDIEEAISLSKELNNMVLLKRCYGIAYDIYEKQGNADKSHTYFEMYSALDQEIKKQQMTEISDEADRKVNKAQTEKIQTQEKLNQTSEQLEQTVTTLEKVEKLTREQQMEIDLKEAKISEQKALLQAERLRRRFWLIGFIISVCFILILAFMIIQIFKANRKINAQRLTLEKQNKEIKASIRYAQTIQQAMLPPDCEIEQYFNPVILYMPKDIVSGDFYWTASKAEGKKTIVYFAVVDCTGHGVPGAFMSMIGNRLLNEIVMERKVDSPAEILELLNKMVRQALRQEETDNNDGMDIALCRFEILSQGEYSLTFSGAKRPVYIIKNRENKLITHNGDRKSIGGYNLSKREIRFTNFEEKLEEGDMVYLFSDGIIDQNGPERKKFGRVRMEEAMIDCAKLRTEEQKVIFEQRLKDYMEDEDQRDDISFVGLKMI